MAKFNLRTAKAAAQQTKPIESGFFHTRISQIAEVGLQSSYNPDDKPQPQTGFAFQLVDGRIITKLMNHSASPLSWMGKLAAALPDVDDIPDFLGQTVDLELEANGNWPKLVGISSPEDGLAVAGTFPEVELLLYDFEVDGPEILKKLDRNLRQAVSQRIRYKADVGAEHDDI
jgi:hypothetical protein